MAERLNCSARTICRHRAEARDAKLIEVQGEAIEVFSMEDFAALRGRLL